MDKEMMLRLVQQGTGEVIQHRRFLHENPELSGEEKATAAYVAGSLSKIGIEDILTGVGGFGVIAMIRGKGPGKCVGLRADMDALPVQEQTGLPFASKTAGISHACGHDCHTAMLLGAAKVLHLMRNSFCGTVKLIFQPAEEEPRISGARAMIAAGAMDDPRVDCMFAQHVDPDYAVGSIGIREGAISAASDRFYIDLHGKGCHGGFPQDGVDAVLMASQTVLALQSIVSRQISPMDNAVITVGSLHSGTKANVVAEHARLEGTCRSFDPSVRALLEDRIERTVHAVAEANNGKYAFEYFKGYPSVINDPHMTALLRLACDAADIPAIQMKAARMGGEDFAYYTERVPSVMYRLGCSAPDDSLIRYKAHNSHFSPDESALYYGTLLFCSAAMTALEQD